APDLPGEKLRIYRNDMHVNYRQALDVYQKLGDELEKASAARKLDATEESLRRRALFMVADCHFELGSYEEALRGYQGLAQRCRGRIEGLMACERLMRCCLLAG